MKLNVVNFWTVTLVEDDVPVAALAATAREVVMVKIVDKYMIPITG